MFYCSRLLVYFTVLMNSSWSSMKPVECVEQVCEFAFGGFHVNSFDGNTEVLYKCLIKEVQLTNFYEPVKTQLHVNSSIDVTALGYYGDKVYMKFIPNSIFTTFPKIKYFWIGGVQEFDSLKSEYLRNANNLKVIDVYSTTIWKLDKNVFVEAPKLEYINFHGNMIESVHRETFNGLKYLKGIYLYNNRITNLHPTTFSQHAKLLDLRLSGNFCRIRNYERAHRKFKEIEADIRKNCEYSPTMEDWVVKVKLLEATIVKKVAEVKKFENDIRVMNIKFKNLEENSRILKNRLEDKDFEMNRKIEQLIVLIDKKHEIVQSENTALVVRIKENNEVFNEKIKDSEMRCKEHLDNFHSDKFEAERYHSLKYGKSLFYYG